MKSAQLRELNDEQLADNLVETCRELFRTRFQGATEKLQSPAKVRQLRRDIARVKTIQRQREQQAFDARLQAVHDDDLNQNLSEARKNLKAARVALATECKGTPGEVRRLRVRVALLVDEQKRRQSKKK